MKVSGVQVGFISRLKWGVDSGGLVSVRQMYPGHSMQVGQAVISPRHRELWMKGSLVGDDDIKSGDIDRILWALAMRYDLIEVLR